MDRFFFLNKNLKIHFLNVDFYIKIFILLYKKQKVKLCCKYVRV